VFKEIDRVLILACGTSYYSGCTAKYWLEASPASHPGGGGQRIPLPHQRAQPRTLVVTISQSGETADTLAALRHAQSLGMSTR
jgi:glucosamine--fructose-6-phosphate aminotransferase (isomerizing)